MAKNKNNNKRNNPYGGVKGSAKSGSSKSSAPAASAPTTSAPAPIVRPANVQASYTDAGSGTRYDSRPIQTDKGIYWSAGPMSDDEVRAYITGASRTGFNADGTAWQGGQQAAATAQGANATPPSYKNIKNIKEGLAIGGNQYLSAKEAMKISKATGKDYDKVLQKGMDKGMSISGGAIRRSNKAYGSSRAGIWNSMAGDVFGKGFASKAFPDSLGMFRDQKPGNKQAFSGSTVQMDGRTLPVWSPKTQGTTNPLTIKSTTTTDTGNTTTTGSMANDTTAMPGGSAVTPEPIPPEEPLGPGGLLGGDGGGRSATGLSRKKSRQQTLRIRGAGTSLFNRANPYQSALNS